MCVSATIATIGRAYAAPAVAGSKRGLDRRVVAEPRLAPAVLVVAADRAQARRGEHVVEPVRGLAPGAGVHDPADVVAVVAVEQPEDVAQVPVGEADQQPALGRVPALLVSRVVGGERLDLAVDALAAGRVEVAAEDPVPLASGRARAAISASQVSALISPFDGAGGMWAL